MERRAQSVKFILYVLICMLCIISNVTALVFQLLFYELPCPLCLMQRYGFLAVGYGCVLSIKENSKVEHNIIIIISIIYTMVVAIRQMLLHIAPHDLGYGSTFLGIHFYTWSALISISFITLMALLPVLENSINTFFLKKSYLSRLPSLMLKSILILTIINVISMYLECGFTMCPANPIRYMH